MIDRIKFFIQRRNKEWFYVRKKFLKYNDECEACGTKRKLEVHHVIPVKKRKDLELEETILITLCKYCHLIFGHFKNWNCYNVHVGIDAKSFRIKKEYQIRHIRNS